MDRDTFIIAVYCLGVEHYQALPAHRPVRRGGFAPTLSDEEVSTMESGGEYFKLSSDKDLWQYFRTHLTTFFQPWGTAPAWCGKLPTSGSSKRLSSNA